ncbi:hypothetical protein [Hymenobacter cellulosilyticus]|uniref:Uncharacterized protein n=1 Tax=Hymenobacter cellulosilyticus TaxID=2932248 RepID=A0A8T9QAX5_9BACT|nr:hypothetical protein [Hymenobacter cellulosilyticus]UOQ74716.1 hypothetical protein MUN79_13065 [Hymenobacter cellulosilyticus]
MLRDLLNLRLYLVVALLIYGGYVWVSLNGIRLLGDDNETTENLNGTGSHSSGRVGRANYYHK